MNLKKKGQGLVPSTFVGWVIALGFLALMIFIAMTYKDQLFTGLKKIADIFTFWR